ncbi:MAG: NEW3 domain-containing protein, partial [Gemmatimonadaceae bacterium]
MSLRRALAFAVSTFVVAGAPSVLFAQANEALSVRAGRRDTIAASTTVTVPFTVSNSGGDIAHVRPLVHVPAGWPLLMGTTPFAVAPNASSMLMVSVVVPSRAIAGTYTVSVEVGARGRDSIIVRVPQRRSLEVTLVDKPGYVISGEPYDARFLVRNRGNLPTYVRVRARSTLGRAALTDSVVRVGTDASATVPVRVATPRGLSAATDDVVELTATEDGVAGVHVASARVTIVPEPTRSIEEFLRMPTQVNLRAASSDAVSPFEIFGRGPIHDGGDSEVDFLFRGPTGPYSAFGERDVYRVSLTAPNWRARAGDQIYVISPLTGGGQPGFGGALDGSYGMFSAGSHVQQFRRSPVRGTEIGGFVGAGSSDGPRAALNYIWRDGGVLPGEVASATAGFAGAVSVDAELARSRDAAGEGTGGLVRLGHSGDAYSVDAGHQQGDAMFSGPLRGARHSHLTATGHWLQDVSFALSAGSHRSDLSQVTGVPYVQTLDLATLGATWLGRYSLELGAVNRATTIFSTRQTGTQQSVRARAD